MKTYAAQIRAHVPGRFLALGTDGFGRSDGRDNLRRHFEVSAEYIVVAALSELCHEGQVKQAVVAEAIKAFEIDTERTAPLYA